MNPASAQISEAKQAIYRLASFPESEMDLRITKNLYICHAQTKTQKNLSKITCGWLYSRRAYDENTNLVSVYSALRESIRLLADQADFQHNVGGLQEACMKAIRIFNAVIDRCAYNRAKIKEDLVSSLKMHLPTLLVEFDREKMNIALPTYPLLPNGLIDYDTLFKIPGSPSSPGSSFRSIAEPLKKDL